MSLLSPAFYRAFTPALDGTGKVRPTVVRGQPGFDDGAVEIILSLLMEDEGWSTKGRRRGPGPRSVKFADREALSKIKGYSEERLQLAIDDGRLKSASVAVSVVNGQPVIAVSYVTKSGRRDLVTTSLVF
jgi:phage gp46-like protein